MAEITHLFPGGFQPPATQHTESPEVLFRDALRDGGLVAPQSLKVGEIDRVDMIDEPAGRKSGWYIFYTDGVASGSFGSWKDDSKTSWCARDNLTPAEQLIHNRSMELARQAREEALRLRQAQAQATARAHLEATEPAQDAHPYLTRKGIPASGARVNSGGDLMIPVIDTGGEVHSYQRINPEGEKRFLSGGQIRGHFGLIGEPGAVILIAEGFATGASLHAATGLPVVIAFSAGNLGPVAEAIRPAYPTARICVCGDSDDVGASKATEAAERIGGVSVTPVFATERLEPYTDWNDLHASEGLDAVTRQIGAVLHQRRVPMMSLHEGIAALQAPQWLIKGVLERGVLNMTYGAAGIGKSFFEIDRACHIAHGREYFGHPVKTPGLVVYVAGEGHHGIFRRFKAWHQYHGVEVDENVPVKVTLRAIDLLDDGDMHDLAATIDEYIEIHGPLRYLIIDTLWQNAATEDENSAAETRKVVQRVREHIQDRFGAAVTLIHHTGRGNLGGDGMPRGSSAWDGALDSMFILHNEPHSKAFHAFPKKMKEAESGPDSGKLLTLQQVPLEGLDDEDGEATTSAVIIEEQQAPVPVWMENELNDLQQKVFMRLSDFCAAARIRNMPSAFGRAEFSKGCVDSGLGQKSQISEAIKVMIGKEIITESGSGGARLIEVNYQKVALLAAEAVGGHHFQDFND